MRLLLSCIICLLLIPTYATQWNVGAGLTYTKPSAVVNLVQNGDTVNILAGLYTNDVAQWNKDSLLLRGVGGFAHLNAPNTSSGGKAIWVINGKNYRIEYIEFSGCTVPDKNGAGIRQQGTSVTISHCYFHDNDEGILTTSDSLCDILIEYTEFKHNGFGDGYSHNMYINHIHSFTLQYCYTHLAKIGHNVKSRAHRNYILYNRIMDEETGNSSYDIDLPNGGQAFIIGNVIHKGTQAQNPYTISYGEEGYIDSTYVKTDKLNVLCVVNNTMVNQLAAHSPCFIKAAAGPDTVMVLNNLYIGFGPLLLSPVATLVANNKAGTIADVVDTATFNYHLKAGSGAIDSAITPGTVAHINLAPIAQYVYPDTAETRGICGHALDIGAYEFVVTTRDTISKAICKGENFNGHSTQGTYIDTFSAMVGCDSIVQLQLTVNTPDTPTISMQTSSLSSSPASHYQWFHNEAQLPGDTNRVLNVSTAGDYYVQTIDSNGCNAQSAILILEGVIDPTSDFHIHLYPNPSTGPVTLDISGIAADKEVSIKIWNPIGQLMMEQVEHPTGKNLKTTVELSNYSTGVYFIQVQQGNWINHQTIQLL